MKAVWGAIALGSMGFGCSGEDVLEYSRETTDVWETSEFNEPGFELVNDGGAPDAGDGDKSRFDASYGVSIGSSNAQFRCAAGQAGDCRIPLFRTVQVGLNVDGVPLNADRTMFGSMLTEAMRLANLPDNGFSYHRENGTGCAPDEVCLTFFAQSPLSFPAGLATDDVRRYIGLQYGQVNDMGTHGTWKQMSARANWTSLKTFRGDATCAGAIPGGDVCLNGMKHLLLNAILAASGSGITNSASGTANGADRDVDGQTGPFASAGDVCRQRDYDPGFAQEFAVDPDACGL